MPSLTPEMVKELVQSRLDGKGDVHFYALESWKKIRDFLEAKSPTALEHARFMMAGAVQSLYNALQKDGAYPKPERQ